MNFPIMYYSTYKLSDDELKKYVFEFKDHSVDFSTFDGLRLYSFHKYDDDLQIRLDWLLSRVKKNEFTLPITLNELLDLYDNEVISYSRGLIIKYSADSLTNVPDEETKQIFQNSILSERARLSEDVYKILEFPDYKINPLISNSKLDEMVKNFQMFEQYLMNKNKTKKHNNKESNN